MAGTDERMLLFVRTNLQTSVCVAVRRQAKCGELMAETIKVHKTHFPQLGKLKATGLLKFAEGDRGSNAGTGFRVPPNYTVSVAYKDRESATVLLERVDQAEAPETPDLPAPTQPRPQALEAPQSPQKQGGEQQQQQQGKKKRNGSSGTARSRKRAERANNGKTKKSGPPSQQNQKTQNGINKQRGQKNKQQQQQNKNKKQKPNKAKAPSPGDKSTPASKASEETKESKAEEGSREPAAAEVKPEGVQEAPKAEPRQSTPKKSLAASALAEYKAQQVRLPPAASAPGATRRGQLGAPPPPPLLSSVLLPLLEVRCMAQMPPCYDISSRCGKSYAVPTVFLVCPPFPFRPRPLQGGRA